MAATTDTPDAQAVYDLAMKLSPEERDRLVELLTAADRPPPLGEADRAALRAELQRVHDAVRNGTIPTYTIEEAMAHLRKARAERVGA